MKFTMLCGSHTLFPDYPNISKSTEKAYTAHWHSILWLWIACVPNNKHFTDSLVQKKREYTKPTSLCVTCMNTWQNPAYYASQTLPE